MNLDLVKVIKACHHKSSISTKKIWNARKLYLDYCPKTHRKAVIIILRVIMVR